jgi:tetratricopeptide (TPR) repeat protein
MKKVCCNLLIWLVLSASAFAGDYDLYVKSGHRSASWDGMIKAGFSSFDTGDYQTGIVFLQKAYNTGCRDGLLLFKLGLYFETQRNYKEAEKYLKEAQVKLPEQYPDYPETKRMHEHLARLYYQANQFDKAMPELLEALKITPDSFMLLFMSAQILRLNKNYPQAIAAFEKALTVIEKTATPSPRPSPTRGEGTGTSPSPSRGEGTGTSPSPSMGEGTGTSPSPSMGEGQGGGDPKLAMTARKAIFSELMTLYFELKDYPNCLKYAELVLKIQPNDAAALSYRQQIQTMQYKQREQEAIKKIVE